jgi:hypothetical protein
MIHERFCCNRGFAAATSLPADGLAPRSVDILFKDASLTAPRARLAWRLRDFATNRHEYAG